MGELVLHKVKERNKKTIFSALPMHYSSTPTLPGPDLICIAEFSRLRLQDIAAIMALSSQVATGRAIIPCE